MWRPSSSPCVYRLRADLRLCEVIIAINGRITSSAGPHFAAVTRGKLGARQKPNDVD